MQQLGPPVGIPAALSVCVRSHAWQPLLDPHMNVHIHAQELDETEAANAAAEKKHDGLAKVSRMHLPALKRCGLALVSHHGMTTSAGQLVTCPPMP